MTTDQPNIREPPEILEIRPAWKLGWNNIPGIEVLLSRIAEWSEFRFEERAHAYMAVFGAEVRFLYHSGEPERQDGFGGRHFKLRMKDGRTVTLKGPWSSNSSSINLIFGTDCVEAAVTDNMVDWKRGHTFYASAVSGEAVLAWMEKNPQNWDFVRTRFYHGAYWHPMLKGIVGVPCEVCKGFKEYYDPFASANMVCRRCRGTGTERNDESQTGGA